MAKDKLASDILKVSERDIKKTCGEFLSALQNMKRLIFLRLNSGDILTGEGEAKRLVRCCPAGTSDSIVILPKSRGVIFVEYKSKKGKQSRDQLAFEKKVTEQGHEYWLVSDYDAFNEAIAEVLRQ